MSFFQEDLKIKIISAKNIIIEKENIEIITINKDTNFLKIKESLIGADLIFIIIDNKIEKEIINLITQISKDIDALTIGVVNNELNFLKKYCDTVITISNSKNFAIEVVNEIINMLIGENNLKVDFNDFKHLMSNGEIAFTSKAHKLGKNSAYEALNDAIKFSSLDDIDIMNAKGLLISVTTNENYPMVDFDNALESVLGEFIDKEDVTIFQGETDDDLLADDEIKVTIIATGFEI
jgi:cell division protein FtsZ